MVYTLEYIGIMGYRQVMASSPDELAQGPRHPVYHCPLNPLV